MSMDRIAVLEQLEPVLNSHLRKVDHRDGARVTFADDTAVLRPGRGARSIPFTEEGYGNFLNFMGIPMPMARVLTPDTKNRVANEILTLKDQYALVVRDNAITSVAKPRQINNAVNAEKVLRTIEKVDNTITYNRVMLLDGSKAHMELTSSRQETVARGDLVQAGAIVEFSPLGISLPSVQSFVLQLACTNGNESCDVLRQYGYGEGDDIWQFFRKSVKDAIKSVVKIAARWRQMMDDHIPPEERAMVLEAMIKEAKLPTVIAEAVRARALAQPPENAYDVMNLITYAGSHDGLEPVRAIRARRAAAKFASESEHAKICPACRRNR